MADFQTSTHRAKWIFKPEELVGKYKAANQRAIQTLEKYGAILMEVDVDGTISYPEPQVIAKVVMQATALIYFKRFYLQWSVMQHHPKNIMLTCIYAACKIAENHVSAEELGKGISQDHQMILNNEMIVYQSLEFDLIVYAPYRSIEGFIDDMGEFCGLNDDRLQILQKLLHAAKMEVDKIMLTDAPLLFPPGQLALAALRNANQVHEVVDFERYLRSILSRQSSEHTVSELVEFLNAIGSWARKYKFPSDKDLKHIYRKLKSCWGLSSHDESKKRDKKLKHKSKRSSNEVQPVPSHTEM